jgi:hypothetical protein
MDMNNIPDRYPNLTIEELEIIGYFTRGQKYSFSSKNLKLEFSETSIRLSDRQGKLLGISKQINEWQRKVLVSNSSNSTAKIIEVLTEGGFIAKEKSSHPDFAEYHFYKVPDGYKLNYTKILQLWKVWWNNKCDSLSLLQRQTLREGDDMGTERLHQRLNSQKPIFAPLIFSKGSWHQIQDLQPQQEHFLLQMVKGDSIICAEDLVVWVDKSQSPSITTPSQSTPENISTQSIPLTPSKSSKSSMPTPTQVLQLPIVPIPPLQMPEEDNFDLNTQHDEDRDLEVYLSTFNTEDTEDVDRIEGIYNIDELLGGTMPKSDLLPPSQKSKSTMRLEVKVIDTPDDNLPISEPPIGMQPNSAPIVPPPPPKSPKFIPNSKASNPTPVPPSSKVPVPEPSLPNLSIESSPMLSSSEQKILLKVKAFEALSKYVRQGDCVTHTETIKNTQGEVINRKTIEIQRGCPSWAIDLIQSL